MNISKLFLLYFLFNSFPILVQASSTNKDYLEKELSSLSHIATVEEMIDAYHNKKIDDPDLKKFYPSRLFENLSHQLMDQRRELSDENLKNIFQTGMLGYYFATGFTLTAPFDFSFFISELKNRTTPNLGRGHHPFECLRLKKDQITFLKNFSNGERINIDGLLSGDKFLNLFLKENNKLVKASLTSFMEKVKSKHQCMTNTLLFSDFSKMDNSFLMFALEFGSPRAAEYSFQMAKMTNNPIMKKLWYQKAATTGYTVGIQAMAIFSEDCKNFQDAEKWNRKLVERNDFTCAIEYLLLLRRNDRHEDFEKWVVELVDSFPSSQSEDLGNALKGFGKFVEAEKCFKKAVKKGSVTAMISLGHISSNLQNLEEAKKHYRKALEKGSEVQKKELRERLGSILLQEADTQLEEEKFSEAEKLYHESANMGSLEAVIRLGNLKKEKSIKEAIEWYKKNLKKRSAIKVDDLRGIEKIKIELAVCLKEKGDIQPAEDIFMELRDNLFYQESPAYHLGNIFGMQKRFQDAYQFTEFFRIKGEKAEIYQCNNHLFLEGFSEFPVGWSENEKLREWADNITQHYPGKYLLKYIDHISSEEPEEKDRLYKRAISEGAENAEILYADFLRQRNLISQAEEFEELVEEDESEKTSSSDQGLDESEASSIEELSDSEETVSSSSSSELVKILEKDKKKKTKEEKRIRRVEKARASLPDFSRMSPVKGNDETNFTYRDLIVRAHKGACSEIEEKKFIVQNRLSHLANGDFSRANFESLKETEEVFSMRLNKVDRLVFQMKRGNDGCIKEVNILSAKGHYSTLKKRLKSNTDNKVVNWN